MTLTFSDHLALKRLVCHASDEFRTLSKDEMKEIVIELFSKTLTDLSYLFDRVLIKYLFAYDVEEAYGTYILAIVITWNLHLIISQNDQTQLKNLATFAARFFKVRLTILGRLKPLRKSLTDGNLRFAEHQNLKFALHNSFM